MLLLILWFFFTSVLISKFSLKAGNYVKQRIIGDSNFLNVLKPDQKVIKFNMQNSVRSYLESESTVDLPSIESDKNIKIHNKTAKVNI